MTQEPATTTHEPAPQSSGRGLDHLLVDETLVVLDCRQCGDERGFAPVDCLDGHTECPERACTECGSAVLLASFLPASAPSATAAGEASGVRTDSAALTAELLAHALPSRSTLLSQTLQPVARGSRLVG